jgi:hypothetical protein
LAADVAEHGGGLPWSLEAELLATDMGEHIGGLPWPLGADLHVDGCGRARRWSPFFVGHCRRVEIYKFIFSTLKIVLGFDLDRDCKVQGINDRDLKFKVHFAKPLRIQGLKWTFSLKQLNRCLYDVDMQRKVD